MQATDHAYIHKHYINLSLVPEIVWAQQAALLVLLKPRLFLVDLLRILNHPTNNLKREFRLRTTMTMDYLVAKIIRIHHQKNIHIIGHYGFPWASVYVVFSIPISPTFRGYWSSWRISVICSTWQMSATTATARLVWRMKIKKVTRERIPIIPSIMQNSTLIWSLMFNLRVEERWIRQL